MDFSLPQAYLIGLLVILGGAAVLVARQILRVRRDELALIRLEQSSKSSDHSFIITEQQIQQFPMLSAN